MKRNALKGIVDGRNIRRKKLREHQQLIYLWHWIAFRKLNGTKAFSISKSVTIKHKKPFKPVSSSFLPSSMHLIPFPVGVSIKSTKQCYSQAKCLVKGSLIIIIVENFTYFVHWINILSEDSLYLHINHKSLNTITYCVLILAFFKSFLLFHSVFERYDSIWSLQSLVFTKNRKNCVGDVFNFFAPDILFWCALTLFFWLLLF